MASAAVPHHGRAVLADIGPPERRARAFGLIGVAFGLGFILGPGLGGWLASTLYRSGLHGHAVLNLLVVLTMLPEPILLKHGRICTASSSTFRQGGRRWANSSVASSGFSCSSSLSMALRPSWFSISNRHSRDRARHNGL